MPMLRLGSWGKPLEPTGRILVSDGLSLTPLSEFSLPVSKLYSQDTQQMHPSVNSGFSRKLRKSSRKR